MSSVFNITTGECISGTCQSLAVSKELLSWFVILALVLGVLGLSFSIIHEIISHKQRSAK